MSRTDDEIAADVAEYGWAVISIPEDTAGPGFSYTVGLQRSFGHPEILLAGLPPPTAHSVLNDAGEMVRAGRTFTPGAVTAELLEGYDATFRPVPEFQFPAYLGEALRFYNGEPLQVLQLVYPDRGGRWPWDEGVHAGFRAAQPVLEHEPYPAWARDDE